MTVESTAAPPEAPATPEAEFVQRFRDAWADPSPERLNALLHPDGRLLQPIEPEIRGHAEAARTWRRLFYLLPDCRAEVLSWSGADGLVFIQAASAARSRGGGSSGPSSTGSAWRTA